MIERPRLIQEEYLDTDWAPWKVLVICQCLNLAAWPVAEIVAKELFERFPGPYDCDEVSLDPEMESFKELFGIVRCIGFGNKRIKYLVEMSRQYTHCYEIYHETYDRYPIMKFNGCGEYANDAWTLMVLGKRCAPRDKHLMRYAVKKGLLP